MWDAIRLLFDTSGFPPRWYCGNWSEVHGWTHIVADIATGASYYAIPLLLLLFVRKRQDVPFPRIFILFGIFILACGTVHFVEATIFWNPWYRLSAFVKVVTALASILTVAALIPVMPRAIALPGLEAVNAELRQEIDHRMRTEAQLRESNQQLQEYNARLEQFRSLVESSPNALLLIDRNGNIAFSNQKAHSIFGYKGDEMAGVNVDCLVPEGLRDAHVQHRNAFFAAPESRPMGEGRDLLAVRKDGKNFPVEVGLNPVAAGGKQYVVAVVVDITHRKAVEESIRKTNEDLEKSNRELDQFVHTVSHDLKTPIVSIQLLLGLLERDVQKEKFQNFNEHITDLKTAAKEMVRMIEDLLDFSRIGRIEQKLEPINLRELLPSILKKHEMLLADRGVTVEYADKFPTINFVQTSMMQLLDNLIGNAIRHNRGRENLTIKIDWVKQRGHTCIRVADNGVGIDPIYHGKIFELFERVDTSQDGTGIGLSIVKRIMENIGGTVWVDSEKGNGACFYLAIPDKLIAENAVQD